MKTTGRTVYATGVNTVPLIGAPLGNLQVVAKDTILAENSNKEVFWWHAREWWLEPSNSYDGFRFILKSLKPKQ